MEKRYTLKSADGELLEVGNDVISHCGLLSFVTEDCAECMKEEEKPTIPVPCVKSETLRIIIHLAQTMGSQPECCEALLSTVDVAVLIRIIHAADYLISLDILDLACKVANMRISEDSRMDLLYKHGSPTRVGHFASILGGFKTLKL